MMPGTVQEFLATSAEKAASDLKAAFLRLPEDKWNWKPGEEARPAIDLLAEVALLNASSAWVIQNRAWNPNFDREAYEREKAALCHDWAALEVLLQTNTARVMEAIRAVPDADLAVDVSMPWGPMPTHQLIAYPYWNATYHEGQINYIAAQLGLH